MKTKGITIWEQHTEKMVLGIAAVLLVVFSAMQFVGEPNAVSAPGGETVAPHEIDPLLEAEAVRLLGRLDEAAPPEVQLLDPVPAADYLLTQVDQSLSPKSTLPQFAVAIGPQVDWFEHQRGVEFYVPVVKPPYDSVAQSYSDTLAEGVLEEHNELEQLFDDPTQPHDVTFVTAAAHFDVADLQSQFRPSEDDLEARDQVAIPPPWFHDRPDSIVDVVIERQELDDGHWTNDVVLDPIPGQHTFRAELAGDIGAATRDQILEQLVDPAVQLDIVRPEFYPTKNAYWSPPVLTPEIPDDLAPEDEQVVSIRRRIEQLRGDRERLLKRLDDLDGSMAGGGEEGGVPGGEPPPGRGRDPGEGRGGGRRGPPGSGGGFDQGSGGRGKRPKGEEGEEGEVNKRKFDNLRKRIKRLDAQIATWEKKLAPFLDPEVVDQGLPDLSDDQPQGAEETEIMVWGHDLSVEQGKTYRYRLTIKLYNPLFGKKRSLVDKQQDLAESFTLSSATSEWSAPVRVDPVLREFVVRADPGGQGALGGLGLGRATVEVYRFYDGRQWAATFIVDVGDYIGGVKDFRLPDGDETVQIDFNTELLLLDVVEDVNARRSGPLEDGLTAKVLLQDLRTGQILALRDPRLEKVDPDRLRLEVREEVDSAGL